MTIASVIPVGLPPREAVAYLSRKGYAIGFDWRDLMRAAHARAFTVAKVARVDVLEDIRKAVDRAIAEGITKEQFEKELTPILQAKGWWGRRLMQDPASGETTEVQLGSARRLATIYETNVRTSLSAGRWEQIQRTKVRRPFLRYIHLDGAHPRPQHAAWNNLVLPIDDPFWQTHFPPNGWGCKCSAQQLSDRDLERYGFSVGQSPAIEYRTWENKRTGRREQVPVGIDPGFDYNPGTAGQRYYDELLATRLAGVPDDLRGPLG